jgi:hypothetical protein
MAVTALIETVTVGAGGAASITFASIAADWTDLKIVVSSRFATSATDVPVKLLFNGGAFTSRLLYGTGSSVGSQSPTDYIGWTSANTGTANTFGSLSLYIPNYASSGAKSFSTDAVQENNSTPAFQSISGGLTTTTTAITSIVITDQSIGSNFVEHSTASLYGIKYD